MPYSLNIMEAMSFMTTEYIMQYCRDLIYLFQTGYLNCSFESILHRMFQRWRSYISQKNQRRDFSEHFFFCRTNTTSVFQPKVKTSHVFLFLVICIAVKQLKTTQTWLFTIMRNYQDLLYSKV